MKTWQQTLFGILIGLTLAAFILMILRSPDGEGIKLLPAPTPKPLMVHITGEVQQPGVYEIQRNSRIIDAINVAGGFSAKADVNAVNQADFIQDGSKIVIPSIEEVNNSQVEGSVVLQEKPIEEKPAGLVNINTAGQEEMENLPNIGPAKAADIIAYRLKNGKFVKIEDIMKVSGIGQVTFDKIKDLITVN